MFGNTPLRLTAGLLTGLLLTVVIATVITRTDSGVDAAPNLVTNDTFEADVSGWTAEAGITLAHAPGEDADGDPPGALLVEVSTALGADAGAAQCINLAGTGADV